MKAAYAGLSRTARPSRRKLAPEGSRLVIVGNGMVGAKFCETLVEEGLNQRFQITVIGAEPLPAYDRIKLSS